MNNIEVSIIIPCRNEESYICSFEEIIEYTNKYINCEYIFIDGMSEDNTVAKIEKLCFKYRNVKLFKNIKKTTPHALNIGIENSKGEYICRMDCHSKYNKDYIEKLYNQFKTQQVKIKNLGNVGGIVNTLPRNNTATSKAISEILSSKFGMGNSTFRVANTVEELIEVDTVPFGFYKSAILKQYRYDVSLTKNQDEFLNLQLIKSGYKILCDTTIVIDYYPVDRISSFIKMFYNYGLYKPLVFKKIKKLPRVRHIVPLFFLLYLILLPFSSMLFPYNLSLLCIYIVMNAYFSFKKYDSSIFFIINKKNGLKFLLYPMLHLSYGFGLLKGLAWMVKNDK